MPTMTRTPPTDERRLAVMYAVYPDDADGPCEPPARKAARAGELPFDRRKVARAAASIDGPRHPSCAVLRRGRLGCRAPLRTFVEGDGRHPGRSTGRRRPRRPRRGGAASTGRNPSARRTRPPGPPPRTTMHPTPWTRNGRRGGPASPVSRRPSPSRAPPRRARKTSPISVQICSTALRGSSSAPIANPAGAGPGRPGTTHTVDPAAPQDDVDISERVRDGEVIRHVVRTAGGGVRCTVAGENADWHLTSGDLVKPTQRWGSCRTCCRASTQSTTDSVTPGAGATTTTTCPPARATPRHGSGSRRRSSRTAGSAYRSQRPRSSGGRTTSRTSPTRSASATRAPRWST